MRAASMKRDDAVQGIFFGRSELLDLTERPRYERARRQLHRGGTLRKQQPAVNASVLRQENQQPVTDGRYLVVHSDRRRRDVRSLRKRLRV